MDNAASKRRSALRVVLWAVLALPPVFWTQAAALAQMLSAVSPGEAMTDSEARLELARLLSHSQTTLGQAETEYRRVLAASRHNIVIELELADVLARMGRYRDALKILEPLAGSAVPRPEAVSKLGDVRLYSGDVPGAAAAYAKAYSIKQSLPGLDSKLAQALVWSGRPREALAILERLHAARPQDASMTVLLAQALAATGGRVRAAALIDGLLGKDPENADLLLIAADIQAGMGRAIEAKRLFERAEKLDATGKARSAHADRSVIWGDFYRAEDGVRSEMAAAGNNRQLTLKLAGVLSGAQRYEEAAELYAALLAKDPDDRKALEGMAGLRLLEKNPAEALQLAKRLSEIDSAGIEALRLETEAKADLADLSGALATARKASDKPDAAQEDFRRLGDLLQRKKEMGQALEAYRRAAAMDPPDPWSSWRAAGEQDAALPSDPAGLADIALRLKSLGRFEKAGRFYRKALQSDPGNFLARMGMAELLAATGWHADALQLLDGLAEDFPGDSKVLLTRARVLGWAKRYADSLAAYEELHRLRPEDPVPLREGARTAFWGKMPGRAAALYATLENGNYPKRARENAALERIAKMQGYDRRFTSAMNANDLLLASEPGNQEALFDRAQAACALGLCDEEKASYQKLLAMDPLHTMAAEAMAGVRRREAPSVRAGFSFWDEDGKSGRLAQITRYRWDIEATLPVAGRYYLLAAQHLWLEDPKSPQETQQTQGGQARLPVRRFDGSYLAEGQTVGVGGRCNQWLSGDFSFTNKQYFDPGLRPLYSGLARIEANLRDVARLGVFYQRTDEITNDMSLAQGIQIDNWGGFLRLQPTRRFEFSFQGRYQNYSDGNQGTLLRADAGYSLTDHPRELKLTATGEYRNTREVSRYIYAGDTLVTIVHPYWTPQDYYSGGLTLGFKHDLAKDYFCGARKHFYGIQVSGGTDTTANPFWRLEAEYMRDMTDNWSFSLKGLVHRSQQWNAIGLWSGLTYRF